MDPMIEIEGGEVLANANDRTITGLLIPYGEKGRTNVGQFEVEAGVIRLPADPVVIGINTDHDRFAPVGRATRVWEETTKGIFASFEIARTPEGDAALADATSPTGTRRCLSGEFRTGIKNGKATGGVLAGAALVARGAFPSAMVLAADTPDPEEPNPEEASSSRYVTRFTDTEGVEWERVSETNSTTTVTRVSGDNPTPDTEATPNPEGASDVTATAIPATHREGAPTAATTANNGPTAAEVMAAFAARVGPDLEGGGVHKAAEAVLAALQDITDDLVAGGEVARPTWLGQLYQGVAYVREYITLGTLGTNITYAGKQGYTLHRGESGAPVNHLGEEWEGNKTEIASGVGYTKGHNSKLFKWAFGADIAREFFDLPGAQEAVEAFFRLVLEDYLIWSDTKALETWRTVAGNPIAAKAYPGVDGHDYANALGMVIQGILAVKAKKSDGRRDVPTFIIANELAYEELIYTPKDLIPEFVNFTASTDGTGSGDGLTLVVGETGITTTPSVIVGARQAVEFDELPGGPVKLDALDLAKGGVDKATYGYLQVFTVREEAVVHIGTADARANTTAYEIGDLAKAGSVIYQATKAGTTGASAPTAPAVGATVADGAVTWKRLA